MGVSSSKRLSFGARKVEGMAQLMAKKCSRSRAERARCELCMLCETTDHSSTADEAEQDTKAVAADLWVTVKAKTTDKVTRRCTRAQWLFRSSTAGVTLGHNTTIRGGRPGCEIKDSSMLPVHARIALVVPPNGDSPYVELRVEGRTYFLVGRKGSHSTPHPLCTGNTLKLGACSLQVMDTVFARPPRADSGCEHSRGGSTGVDGAGGEAGGDSPDGAQLQLDKDLEDVCYICFEGASDPLHEGHDEDDDSPTAGHDPSRVPPGALMQSPCPCKKLVHRRCLLRWVASKGARVCSICKGKLPIEATVDPPYLVLQVVRHMRNLQWNGEYEHLGNLRSFPSSALPLRTLTHEPTIPNSVAGEREFILSFAQHRGAGAAMEGRPVQVNVGTGPSCDLVLPDPSLSRMHAQVSYTPAGHASQGSFIVEDMGSQAGTYLKVQAGHPFRLPMEHEAASLEGTVSASTAAGGGSAAGSTGHGHLSPSLPLGLAGSSMPAELVGVARFKMGRTVLTIRVKKRKPRSGAMAILSSLNNSFRLKGRTASAGSAAQMGHEELSPSRSPAPTSGAGAHASPPSSAVSAPRSTGIARDRGTEGMFTDGFAVTRARPIQNESPDVSFALAMHRMGLAAGEGAAVGGDIGSGRSTGRSLETGRSGADSSSRPVLDVEEARLEAAVQAAMAAAEAEGRTVDLDVPLPVEVSTLALEGRPGHGDDEDEGGLERVGEDTADVED